MTVIELLVALVIGGTALLGARALLGHVADAGAAATRAAAAADREANALRMLRALVGGIEAGTDAAIPFGGDARSARFTSWCDVSAGWKERCAAALVIEAHAGRPALVAALASGERVVLATGAEGMALRYLADPRDGGVWYDNWGTGVTVPVAIGVVVDDDTLIVRIGERG